jgi:hypothetical protein
MGNHAVQYHCIRENRITVFRSLEDLNTFFKKIIFNVGKITVSTIFALPNGVKRRFRKGKAGFC